MKGALKTVNQTGGRACKCETALAGEPAFRHRAAVRYVLGWLAPKPTPMRPVPPACRFACGGKGYHTDPDGKAVPERCPWREAEPVAA